MIDFTKDGAIFSPCERYRYVLTRKFDLWNSRICNFIMLNPSTADATKNDPTVARCCKYAKRWGAGALVVTNIFGFRATDPQDMRAASDPVGVENMPFLLHAASESQLVVCAWGTHGKYRGQGQNVLNMLSEYEIETNCLEITKHGHPKHPLYCKGDLKPIPYKWNCLNRK